MRWASLLNYTKLNATLLTCYRSFLSPCLCLANFLPLRTLPTFVGAYLQLLPLSSNHRTIANETSTAKAVNKLDRHERLGKFCDQLGSHDLELFHSFVTSYCGYENQELWVMRIVSVKRWKNQRESEKAVWRQRFVANITSNVCSPQWVLAVDPCQCSLANFPAHRYLDS